MLFICISRMLVVFYKQGHRSLLASVFYCPEHCSIKHAKWIFCQLTVDMSFWYPCLFISFYWFYSTDDQNMIHWIMQHPKDWEIMLSTYVKISTNHFRLLCILILMHILMEIDVFVVCAEAGGVASAQILLSRTREPIPFPVSRHGW